MHVIVILLSFADPAVISGPSTVAEVPSGELLSACMGAITTPIEYNHN